MEISKVIKERIKAKNKRFHCNDNISEFIQDGELDQLQKEVEGKLQEVMESLVIDTEHDHNTNDTARRVAKMYVKEIFGGRFQPTPRITSFPNMGYKSLYTSGPEEEVIGLSKFNRLVHHIAERPQIQEEMTTQIAQELVTFAKTPNVAVVVKAEHHCMTHRGVREHESDMTTAIMLGAFDRDPALKQEFYDICLSMKGHSK